MEDQELKLSLWITKHKSQFRLAGKIALITMAVLPWIFFVIYLTTYLLNIQKTNQVLTDLGLIRVTTEEISKPDNILITKTSAFESSTGTYDVVSKIRNPNPEFAVSQFTYTFNLGGVTTNPKTGWLLPGEEKYLSLTNFKSTATISQAKLNIYDIKWKRVVDSNILPKTNFIISESEYNLTSLEDVQSQAQGVIYNQSAHGFDQVKVTAVLVYNDEPIAVNQTNINRWLSGQEKTFNFTWAKKYPLTSELKIQTETNILDENNLILP